MTQYKALNCDTIYFPHSFPLLFFLFSHAYYKQLLEAAVTKMERNGKVLKYCFLKEKKMLQNIWALHWEIFLVRLKWLYKRLCRRNSNYISSLLPIFLKSPFTFTVVLSNAMKSLINLPVFLIFKCWQTT